VVVAFAVWRCVDESKRRERGRKEVQGGNKEI
jgi:hypothetical protein